jgi:tetratricopeptide (TPR) repeat protein
MTTDSSRIAKARELFGAGEYSGAQTIFQEALQEFPDDPQLLMMVGLCLRRQGRLDEGIAMLEQAVQAAEDDAEVHVQLARARLDQGDIESARQSIRRCLSDNPNHLYARTLMGQIELHSGRPQAAIESLRTALRVDPDFVPALTGLAIALVELGRSDEARAHADKAVRKDSRDIGAQIAMARVFQAQGHTFFAEQCLRNALELQPDSAEIWAALGDIQASNGHHADAVKALNQALKLGSRTVQDLLKLAGSLRKLGRLDEARQVLARIISDRPEHAEARTRLAEIHLDQDQPEQARSLLAELDSDETPLVILLGARLAEISGQLEQAHAMAAGVHDHDDIEIADQARLLSARIARVKGAAVAARKALEPLINAGRREPQASWLLADIIAADGRIGDARKILERLIESREKFPDSTRARTARRLALMLGRAGEHEDAAKFLAIEGWRTSDYLPRILGQKAAPLFQAYRSLKSLDWSPLEPDDDRPQPIFILGWPGSGRDLLLAALAEPPGGMLLDSATTQRRRDALGLPLDPEKLARLDSPLIRLGRKRFLGELRGAPAIAGTTLIDPDWWEAASLPALARHFPQANVILPRVEAGALELFWRMSGFQDIEPMLAAWNEDEALLDHLRPTLPLNFIEVDLEVLLDQPEQTLKRLGERIGLETGR